MKVTSMRAAGWARGVGCVFAVLWSAALPGWGQNLSGTNPPGFWTDFTIPVGAGTSNLSLVVPGGTGSYSHLLLKRGGTATPADYTFISQLDRTTNAINLEAAELVATNHGLRVSTPPASAAHAFTVLVNTNLPNLRSAAYPVLKPWTFATSGTITNGQWHYFQVDLPANVPGWRIVTSVSQSNAPAIYVRRGALPTTTTYTKSSTSTISVNTITFTETEVSNGTYFVGVMLPAGPARTATYALAAESNTIKAVTWDPGATHEGTQVYTNTNTTGGDYYFVVSTPNSAYGAWRTALNVSTGKAKLYLKSGSLPTSASATYKSERAGSNGVVLQQPSQFNASQTWYLLVQAEPGSLWTLVSGDVYVQPLGTLAADGSSSSGNVTMGAEGVRYFSTAISTGTLAWRLSLSGPTNGVMVKKTAVPVPSSSSYYDQRQSGRLLVVPTYLNSGDQYFIGVDGAPGFAFNLDSRVQPVVDLAFGASTNVAVTNFGYATFRVQVPIEQIAWQIRTANATGDANVAVRRDYVASEFYNDGMSENTSTVPDSVTLVPPKLSDGAFFITVYGATNFACTLANEVPVVTDVDYVFRITNDLPDRTGWRYYRVVDIDQQLGSLGWELALTNQPPGTEIAVRRNAVPGRWNYRNSGTPAVLSSGYVDGSSTMGILQRPAHQADVWYVGVYSPTQTLGNLVLSGAEIAAPPIVFDGAGNSRMLSNLAAGVCAYYRVDVPPTALGWDLRLSNVSTGAPRLYVRRDVLPASVPTWNAVTATTWQTGNQWVPASDWTGLAAPNGVSEVGRLLACGVGNPLEPGTYYVAVSNQGPVVADYTLTSRGIGAGLSIPVADLPFEGGLATNTLLPAREAAYYRVVVPSNVPTWKIRLAVTNGEALLLVQRDALPNIGGNTVPAPVIGGGRKLNKLGHEHYLLLPTNAQPYIAGGVYYLAVVSQGRNPSAGRIGTNGCDYVLESQGELPVSNLGEAGAVDLVQPDSLEGGETKAYDFNVPPDLPGLEVTLENVAGTPFMTLRPDTLWPVTKYPYGRDGGTNATWNDDALITVANPAPGTFRLMVQAATNDIAAGYAIRVHVVGLEPLAFDGGTASITNLPADQWRFFQIEVPSNAVGWDLRLTDVTGGVPRLVVRRDLLPSGLTGTLASATAWPSGVQWAATEDWTELKAADGTNEYGRLLAMGMGNPLEPGTYIAGVIGLPGTSNAVSYTILSRGIGAGFMIPVEDLVFSGGIATHTGLPPREAAYYRVQVPDPTARWKLRLAFAEGDGLLLAQRTALPNVGAQVKVSPAIVSGGRKDQKPGNEHLLDLPEPGLSSITGGVYYVAVVGEGVGSANGLIGTNSSRFVLISEGVPGVTNLGIVGPQPLVHTNDLDDGECGLFQFDVPATVTAFRVTVLTQGPEIGITLTTPGMGFPRSSYDYGRYGGWATQVISRTAGVWSLVLQAKPREDGQTNNVVTNVPYTLIISAVDQSVQDLAFDGGTATVSNQVPDAWRFFRVEVPSNAPGWDLRVIPADTNGKTRMVVRRDAIPVSLSGSSLATTTNWPSGVAWAAGDDWTGYDSPYGVDESGHILAMGMGNPLEPGTYYVGVSGAAGATTPLSYTVLSRGIGEGFLIPIADLPFAGGMAANIALTPREAAYYRVQIPSNTPSWRVRLTTAQGDASLLAQKDIIPNVGAANSPPSPVRGGRKLMKTGKEYYLLLPSSGQSNVAAGTYYLGVVSEGVNPVPPRIGSGPITYFLDSLGPAAVTDLGLLTETETLHPETLGGGEIELYRFSVPAEAPGMEIRLNDRVGNPMATLRPGTALPTSIETYGRDGGQTHTWAITNIFTLQNPTNLSFTLALQAAKSGSSYPDASATLSLRLLPPQELNFAAAQNTNGLTNAASGHLSDNQRQLFKVVVPALFDGQPVLGWKLDLADTAGSSSVRVRRNLPPSDTGAGTSPFTTIQAMLVPPFLTAGTWYVEVRGAGITDFTLTSSPLLPERPAWVMPGVGEPVTTPGLTAPLFGDTGIDPSGVPLPDDQGVYLDQGKTHLYAMVVPTNNQGLVRTRLDAISGNPDLFLRVGHAPTLTHGATGQVGVLYERALTNVVTEYGNWVPLDGRTEVTLRPGTWFLAVRASGLSNARYRMQLSTPVLEVLALNGGSVSNQTMAGGDWKYYRVDIPSPAPEKWVLSFQQQIGNVVVHVRDSIPPGHGTNTLDLRDWAKDAKDPLVAPGYDAPGSYTNGVPPVRPATTYYLGVRAVNDAVFSLRSDTAGGTFTEPPLIAFYGGFASTSLTAFGSAFYRVDTPADGVRWVSTAVHVSNVVVHVQQGTLPTLSQYHYRSTNANSAINQYLIASNSWPWVPNETFYLLVINNSPAVQPFTFIMDGRNLQTDDNDSDGLPDAWERQYLGTTAYGGGDDPDHDRFANAVELQRGLDPGVYNAFDFVWSPAPSRSSGAVLRVQGPSGQVYKIQFGTNLASWTDLGTYTNVTGLIQTLDPAATNLQHRLYRSVLAP